MKFKWIQSHKEIVCANPRKKGGLDRIGSWTLVFFASCFADSEQVCLHFRTLDNPYFSIGTFFVPCFVILSHSQSNLLQHQSHTAAALVLETDFPLITIFIILITGKIIFYFIEEWHKNIWRTMKNYYLSVLLLVSLAAANEVIPKDPPYSGEIAKELTRQEN